MVYETLRNELGLFARILEALAGEAQRLDP